MKLSDTVYNYMKWVTAIVLPALGAFYFGLTQIFPAIPYGTEVVGVISLLTTFLGVVLGISTNTYNKAQTSSAGQDTPSQ